MFEGVVGAGLFSVFKQLWMAWLLGAFQTSVLNIAHTADQRTLILELFVYISLLFTLLTIPFLVLLKRELERRGIIVHLSAPPQAGRSNLSRCGAGAGVLQMQPLWKLSISWLLQMRGQDADSH
jgi:hypothetical protein